MDKSAEKSRIVAENRRIVAGLHPQSLTNFLCSAHPVKTAQAVAARTGQPVKTVERWLALTATPSAFAFARLVVAYGPALLAAAVPGLAWVERAVMIAEREGMAREIATLQTRIAAVAARLDDRP